MDMEKHPTEMVMKTKDELHSFLFVSRNSASYALTINSDVESQEYKTAYVYYFKKQLEDSEIDCCINLLKDLSEDIKRKADNEFLEFFEYGWIRAFIRGCARELECDQDFNITEAIDCLHDYANSLNDLYDTERELIEAYDQSYPGSITINNERNELLNVSGIIADNIKAFYLSCFHGGFRKGAGRKKSTQTKQIRIDADLIEQFKIFSDLYRKQSDSDKQDLLFRLNNAHISFCHDKINS